MSSPVVTYSLPGQTGNFDLAVQQQPSMTKKETLDKLIKIGILAKKYKIISCSAKCSIAIAVSLLVSSFVVLLVTKDSEITLALLIIGAVGACISTYLGCLACYLRKEVTHLNRVVSSQGSSIKNTAEHDSNISASFYDASYETKNVRNSFEEQ